MNAHIARVLIVVLAIACFVSTPGCEEKLTQENYTAVTLGMTRQDVEKLLGEGENQQSTGMNISGAGIPSGSRPSDLATYTWRKGNTEFSVTYKDGKVVSKANNAGY